MRPLRRAAATAVRVRRPFGVASVLVLCMSALFACTDASNSPTGPTGGTPGGAVRLALQPEFHVLSSEMEVAPINVARLTVLDAVTRDTLGGPFTTNVNPSSAEDTLAVSFNLGDGDTHADVIVVIELLNVTDGVESVQWSGVSSPITVTAGADAPAPAPIPIFQGPVQNLSVTSVLISNKPTGLAEGDSVHLVAVAQGNASADIFWHSTDATVATVSASGVVHTLRNGTVAITASAGPHTDTANIAVRARPVSIRITPDTLRAVSQGDDLNFTAVVVDIRGNVIAGETLQWSSANEGVVSSTGNGHFTAVANGTTTIRATSTTAPTLQAASTAIVTQRVAAVTLDVGSFDFTAVGDHHTFVATARDARGNAIPSATLHWRSSNPAAVSLDSTGIAIAAAIGTATVTATSSDGPAATATLTVQQVANALTLTPSAISLASLGDTARIVAHASDHNGTAIAAPVVAWSSSNAAVATVDATGLVKAVASGSTSISATSNGITKQVSVTVSQQPSRVDVTPATDTLDAVGRTIAFTAKIVDRNGNVMPGTIVWTSSASTVASISATGVATAASAGTTTITATFGTVNGTASLTVLQTLAHVSVSPDSAAITGLGVTTAFTVSATDALGARIVNPTLTWTSLNPAVATVDNNGVATSVGFGRTQIVATSGALADTVIVAVVRQKLVLAPHSIAFTNIGATQQLTAELDDAAGNHETVVPTYRVANPAVATVSTTGLVTALAIGSTSVIGTSNGVSDTVAVTVTVNSLMNLRIDTVFVTPADTIAIGSTPVIYVIGQNSGTQNIDTTTYAKLQILSSSNVELFQATVPIPPLVAGTPIAFHVPFLIPVTALPGTVHIRVTADVTNRVIESSEADNVKEYGPIHLIASSLILSEDTVRMSTEGTVQLTATDAGATVSPTYVSTHPAVATVDPNTGYLTAVADGFTRIVATLNGKADTTFVIVGDELPVPDGVTKTWIGTADPLATSWQDDNNWMPRGMPTTSDFVFIPDCSEFYPELHASCYNGGCSPKLTANTQVGGITTGVFFFSDGLDGSELGAAPAFKLAGQSALYASTHQAKESLLARKNVMAARAKQFPGIAPVARHSGVRSSAKRIAELQSAGARLAGVGANGIKASSKLAPVPGAQHAAEFGIGNLSIDLDAYTLDIRGNIPDAVFAGSSSGSASARVILGGSYQNITGLFATTNVDVTGSDVRIAGCDECEDAGLLVLGNLAVSGKLTVQSYAYVDVEDLDENTGGSMLVAGQLIVKSNAEIDADYDIIADGASALVRTTGGDVYSYRDIIAKNGGTVDVGNCAYVYVSRDLRTQTGGFLKMQGNSSTVEVYGTAGFNGGSTDGLLTDGNLILYGDFSSGDASTTTFAASGNHHTTFADWENESHAIYFDVPGTGSNGSHFGNLEICSGNIVSASSDVFVDGDSSTGEDSGNTDAKIDGTLTASGHKVTVNGSLYIENSTGWNVPETTMAGPHGSLYVNNYYDYDNEDATVFLTTNLTVTGDTYLNSQLKLEGNVVVDGADAELGTGFTPHVDISGDVTAKNGGVFDVDNESSVYISGSLKTLTGGHADMTSGSSMDINGDIVLNGGASVWDGGTLSLHGNLTAADANQISTNVSHKIYLEMNEGEQKNTITSGGSTLGTLDYTYSAGVLLNDNLHVYALCDNNGSAHPSVESATGGTITITADDHASLRNASFEDVALNAFVGPENTSPASYINGITFSGFSSSTTQLIMKGDSTSITIDNAHFDLNPTFGSSMIVTTDGTANVTVRSQESDPGAARHEFVTWFQIIT